MEYPFKDLLPLDEVLAREGYYKDWTHLDPEVFYSLTQISEYIKTKGYGIDVRLLIAQLAEHFGLKTTQVVDLANLLQQQFTNLEGVTQSFTNNINSLVAQMEADKAQMEADKDAVIANATVDSEVILARGGEETLGIRVNRIDNRTQLSPDDFTGTDAEKIEKALDYAIRNQIETIELTRVYDVTGSTIYLAEDITLLTYRHVVFRGGTIVKNDPGNVFSSKHATINHNAPRFEHTVFKTTADDCYLLDGNRFIRPNCTNCTFYKMGLANSDSYIQSLRLINCETAQLGCDFIKAQKVYDFVVDQHRGESSISHHLINVQNPSPNDVAFFGFSFTNSLAEGYVNTTPIVLSAGYGLDISGSYFEANKTSIKFIKGTSGTRLSGKIEANVFGDSKSDFDIEFVDFGPTWALTHLTLADNSTDAPSGKYLTNLTQGRVLQRSNNIYAGGKFGPLNREFRKTKTVTATQVNKGASGVEFEFKIPLKDAYSIYNVKNKQYLLNLKFNFGTVINYSGHLTGIMSIDCYYSVAQSAVMVGLNFDKLSERNSGGNANGNVGNPAVFSYHFKETGTKEIDPQATQATIVVSLPHAVYNANPNANLGQLKPIEDMIGETMIDL